MGNVSNVKLGPGKLYFAPVGTTEPTDLTTALNASWVEVGYTEEGHAFTATPSYEGVEVAEEVAPIRYEATGLEMTVEFACAEITADNISKAFNGGTVTTGTGIVTFEPPAAGTDPTRVAILWESSEQIAGKPAERWIYRRCIQTGASQMEHRKAPTKTTIPMSFLLEKPTDGKPHFAAILTDTGV